MVFEGLDNDSLAVFLYCVGQTSMKSELLTNFPPREKNMLNNIITSHLSLTVEVN